MTEPEAMALMSDRGFQEEGEASGKWRRALLTSAQLSTYYVGYTEIADLRRTTGHPDRTVHDRMLAHGSPPSACSAWWSEPHSHTRAEQDLAQRHRPSRAIRRPAPGPRQRRAGPV
jgi:hypothetical protein